ncbi:MAG: hypothetical protein IKB31_06460 [Bacteroidaceae bacterium]|jgi:hypothetical protein|nr:hypothetical protein [Bacteroidaceae bacterium]
MGTIIWLLGIVLCVMAILDVLKKNITGTGKIITIIVLLLTSWIGLAVYYLYAKDHLQEWFK